MRSTKPLTPPTVIACTAPSGRSAPVTTGCQAPLAGSAPRLPAEAGARPGRDRPRLRPPPHLPPPPQRRRRSGACCRPAGRGRVERCGCAASAPLPQRGRAASHSWASRPGAGRAGSTPLSQAATAGDLASAVSPPGINRGPSCPVRVGPAPADQPPVPAQQGVRSHQAPHPQRPREQPGQGGEDRPVDPVQLRSGVLAAQHRDFLAQHQQFGVL